MGKRPKLRLGGCNGGGLIHPAMVGGTHLKTIFIIVFFLNATHKYQRSELNDWNRNDVAKMALKREMRSKAFSKGEKSGSDRDGDRSH